MINLLDFFFPRKCLGCGRVGSYICKWCAKTVKLREQRCSECERPAIYGITHPKCQKKWGIDGLVSFFYYQGLIKKTIKLLKYQFVYDTALTLIDLIPQILITDLNQQLDYYKIYPIPLHKDRLKWRGFNQTEKLAQIISPKLKIPTIKDLLIRHVKRIPQADINAKIQRILNAQGIFSLNLKSDILPSYCLNVLLFDDVWTTGATLKQAAKILKQNGVEKVWALTIAR